jgi:spectinomycin phosphotransferase
MLEPPKIEIGALIDRVRLAFEVPVTDATFLPVGNDSSASSFRLDGSSGPWYLKVLHGPVNPGMVEIPRALAAVGIKHILAPLSTVDGEAIDPGEPFSFVLYPFIEARPGGEVGLTGELRTQLGRWLSSVHEVLPPANVERVVPRELFVPRDEDYLQRACDELDGIQPADDFERKLLASWRLHLDTIRHCLDRTRALARAALDRPMERVMCHADFHAWNVLVEPSGDFIVVDWDDPILAPRERDLMFVSGAIADLDPEGNDFYTGYGPVETDRSLIAYYRFDWTLQEFSDYHQRVFDHSLSDAARREAIGFFDQLFLPDDEVATALRADDEVGGG